MEYTRRLFFRAISAGDMPTESPQELEKAFSNYFKLGKSWGAIMLLQDADVYLQSRNKADLIRNGLGAGEYHVGFFPKSKRDSRFIAFIRLMEDIDG